MNDCVIKCGDDINYILKNKIYSFSFKEFLNDPCNVYSDFPMLDHKKEKFNNIVENKLDDIIYIKVLCFSDFLKLLNKNFNPSNKDIFIEFFDCIVFISNKIKFCESCFIKRYLEGMNSFFSDMISSPKTYQANFMSENSDKLIELSRHEEFIVWDKYLKKYHKSPCLCYPDCKSNTLSNYDYNLSEESMNAIEETKEIDVKNLVGRFSPVRDICYQGNFDNIKCHVYGANSSAPRIEKFLDAHGGKGITKSEAYKSAVFESLERYSARLFGYEQLVTSSYSELKLKRNKVLHPLELSLDLSDDNLNMYRDEKQYEWVLGKDLTNDQILFIPANIVFFPYLKESKFHFISYSTTGLSANSTRERAILQGLLEVIERNSYALTHKALLSVIDLEHDVMGPSKSLQDYLSKFYIKTHLTLLPNSFGINVVHCTLEDQKGNYPIFTHGAGASLDIETAIKRAITEAIQLRTSQILLKEDSGFDKLDNIPNREWGIGNKEFVSPFLNNASNEKKRVSEIKSLATNNTYLDIIKIRDLLKKEGYNIYYVDLTREDIKVPAVRVIVPGLQDIDNRNKENSKVLKNLGIKNELPMFS